MDSSQNAISLSIQETGKGDQKEFKVSLYLKRKGKEERERKEKYKR